LTGASGILGGTILVRLGRIERQEVKEYPAE
jgi:hypothetical protein